MNAAPAMPLAARLPRLRVDYVDAAPAALLADDAVLAVFGFGTAAPSHDDPRYLRIALEPYGSAPLEVWRGQAPVARGRDGDVCWADDGALLFGAIELDEMALTEGGCDIGATAERAYTRLREFAAARGYPHLLRIWNYLDGITEGDADDERYKRFCVGRARGLGVVEAGTLPAATAIGRAEGTTSRRLQVYWLASRTPGTPLENPRQLSAYRYPRQYGPQPPSFARAMLPPGDLPLLLSGTAAITGHQSQHADCTLAQLDETLANFDSLLAAARVRRPSLPLHFGPHSPLKIYVRDREDLPLIATALDQRLDPAVPRLLLQATVCRRELRLEIDGCHGDAA